MGAGSPRPRVPTSPRLERRGSGAWLALALAATLLAAPASAAEVAPARDAWWHHVAETTALGADQAVSQEQAYAHARALAGDIGPRVAHREPFRRAADY